MAGLEAQGVGSCRRAEVEMVRRDDSKQQQHDDLRTPGMVA
jgi:hypothetical protein